MSRTLQALLAVVCLASLGGCYENVVSAKGFGADQTPVAKANVPRDGERVSGYKKIEYKRIP